MIDDIIPELNDLQTLTAVALVDGNLNTSQAILRVIAQKLPQLIEMLEELDNGKI
ncbi:flagellar biosynthesis protein FlgC [uncultured Streptococcus sp.]|uniref:flagellar biosynthesis protein FlgC n=1 Tax=uncultured Streptococcus sp. TaxID=83427 RepID=UPI00262878A5|nr:flagellar biosynthesis protein FlgC [uncultured Streptococcus sp.]